MDTVDLMLDDAYQYNSDFVSRASVKGEIMQPLGPLVRAI